MCFVHRSLDLRTTGLRQSYMVMRATYPKTTLRDKHQGCDVTVCMQIPYKHTTIDNIVDYLKYLNRKSEISVFICLYSAVGSKRMPAVVQLKKSSCPGRLELF